LALSVLIQHEKGLALRGGTHPHEKGLALSVLIQHEKGLALSVLIQHEKGLALRQVELIHMKKGWH
jgi:hypothetical protein